MLISPDHDTVPRAGSIACGACRGREPHDLQRSPHQVLSVFGETLDGPLADLVVRSWGALIALIGAMLIYGAFVPRIRAMVLVVAGASKLAFVALVLSHGGRYIGRQAGIAVAIDLASVTLFAWYLLAARTARARVQT